MTKKTMTSANSKIKAKTINERVNEADSVIEKLQSRLTAIETALANLQKTGLDFIQRQEQSNQQFIGEVQKLENHASTLSSRLATIEEQVGLK